MRSIIDLIMNSYTSSLYTKNYTHYTLDILAFCLYYFLLIKKRRYFILLKQPPIWSVCLWCAFSGRFVRACVRFVWVSFSSFVCRSSRSFFVCVAFRVRFRSFRVSFEFEFLFRVCCRISNSIFRILEVVFWSRILNSSFSLRCSIRFLEFQFSIRISSSSSLNFRVEFRIRLFRFAALFDFSNFDLNLPSKFLVEIFVSSFYSTSRISLLDSISRISISRFEFSIQVSWISNSSFSSSWSIRLLELWWSSSSRIVVLEVAFFIWVLNWTIQFSSKMPIFCAKLRADVAHYSRTIALASLSLPRELCARFSCVKY